MPEASTQCPPTTPPQDPTCPDPSGPFIDYSVEIYRAAQRAALATADEAIVKAKYDKLSGAQGRYDTAWTATKPAWDDLVCQLKRIEQTLEGALDEKVRDKLKDCWEKERSKPAPTPPPDCKKVDEWTCADVDAKVKLAFACPGDEEDLRWLEKAATVCVTARDAEFDRLAALPDEMGTKVTNAATAATAIEKALAGATDAVLRRSYVEYLNLDHEVDGFAMWPKSATEYACKLKLLFTKLLPTHLVRVCLTVAVLVIDRRLALQKEADAAKTATTVDRVLECARDKAPTKPGTPGCDPEDAADGGQDPGTRSGGRDPGTGDPGGGDGDPAGDTAEPVYLAGPPPPGLR